MDSDTTLEIRRKIGVGVGGLGLRLCLLLATPHYAGVVVYSVEGEQMPRLARRRRLRLTET